MPAPKLGLGVENGQREDLDPFSVAQHLAAMTAPQSDGSQPLTQAAAGLCYSISQGEVASRLGLLKLTKPWRDLLAGGEITIKQISKSSVLVKAKKGGGEIVLSLLVGSTHPGRKPVDMMGWCNGYGDKQAVAEWLRPGVWLAGHGAR